MSNIIESGVTVDNFTFPVCNQCKHYISGLKCKAFDEIPEKILNGKNRHLKILNGQTNKIVFELKK